MFSVGATRFERATSASQTRRSSQAELRPDLLDSDTLHFTDRVVVKQLTHTVENKFATLRAAAV